MTKVGDEIEALEERQRECAVQAADRKKRFLARDDIWSRSIRGSVNQLPEAHQLSCLVQAVLNLAETMEERR